MEENKGIRANEAVHVVNDQLFLYGRISTGGGFWDYEEDVVSARKVQFALEHMGDEIEVHINSPGGDVFESITIYNLLKNSNKTVRIIVDGLAASGASLIAMSGKEVLMNTGSMMMIHRASTWFVGNANDCRAVAEQLDAIDASLVSILMTRFNGSQDELEDLLDRETFLTAEQTQEKGLCDAVGNYSQELDAEEVQESIEEGKQIWENSKTRKFEASETKKEQSEGEKAQEFQAVAEAKEDKGEEQSGILGNILKTWEV